MVTLNPYLNFRGSAREAMEFYRSVFGGELTLSTFGDYQASEDPAEKDQIMHGQLEADGGIVLMGADVPSALDLTPGDNISVSLSGGPEDDATLRGYWDQLSSTGTVTVPLEVAPWGDAFGMCVDSFGVHWLVNIAANAT
jgi:PhnB protein